MAPGRDSDTGPEAAMVVGQAIRRLRKSAKLTMVELAQRSGVSQPFLSQLERGVCAPSLTSLYRLAEALGVTPGVFLETENQTGTVVTRSHEGQQIAVTEGSVPQIARVLIPGHRSSLLEAYEYRIVPGQEEQDWFTHRGEDFVYVMDGELLLELVTGEQYRLGPGESAHHSSEVGHRWRLGNDEPVHLLLVVGRGAEPFTSP